MCSKKLNFFIGTSGWNYKEWKNDFYSGIKQKDWLAFYAQNFNAIEVNSTFYRLQQEKTLKNWMEQTPDNFNFSVKGSRYTSHIKRLKDPNESIGKQKENLAPLKQKIKAVLWQLPANFQKDLKKLENFAKALESWPEARQILEFRHTSWFCSDTKNILEDYNLGNCISDAANWPKWEEVCSQIAYIRLHGNRETYRSSYSEEELSKWASMIQKYLAQGYEVHVYFDNTDGQAAYKNAFTLQNILNDK